MKYLKIQNKGLLDIRLVALMGGTTKSNNKYKIGQFGTGLKYTLAYLFRNRIDFKIFVGNSEVKLHIERETICGEEFEIICIEGHRTSITTRMGLDWKPWMIVRELYSNALDEGEAKHEIVDSSNLEVDWNDRDTNITQFYIELTPDFLQVYNDWNKYFIVDRIPMYENNKFALHPTSDNLRIYKQGILIHESKQRALFNYDIKDAQINELREYKGIPSYDFSRILFTINDKKVIQYFLEQLAKADRNTEEKYFESTVDLTYWMTYDTMQEAWKETIGNAKVIHTKAKETIIAKQANVDLSNTIEVPENLYKALTQSFEGIGALRTADKVNEFYEVYDNDLELKLKQVITILEEANYFIHPELKFIFGEFGCKNTNARVNLDTKEVFISQKCKDFSLFRFIAILVEENEHFQTGMNDETREFQQHFIDLYTKSLLDKAQIKL